MKAVRRDSRSPRASSIATRRTMQSVRVKGTDPERSLARALRNIGEVGYRLNARSLPGRPDIAYGRRKVAIFVHGCFWHRCPSCRNPLPRVHREFWRAKFSANRKRDRRKRRALEQAGWRVFEVWECWIREHPDVVPYPVRRALTASP